PRAAAGPSAPRAPAACARSLDVLRALHGEVRPVLRHLRVGLDLHLTVDDLRDLAGVAHALVEDFVDEAAIVGDRGDADHRLLPDVLLAHFGDADVEARAQ